VYIYPAYSQPFPEKFISVGGIYTTDADPYFQPQSVLRPASGPATEKIQMAKPGRLLLAKDAILSRFSRSPQKIYFPAQLASILREYRHAWRLADHTKPRHFISFLTKHGDLRACKFRSGTYGQEITRYSWGEASVLELATLLKPRGYLCHATAVMLHGLARHSSLRKPSLIRSA
jgi:hypothetical protein